MDGSSDWFVRKILSGGIKQLLEPVSVIYVKKEVTVRTDDSYARIVPSDQLI